MEDIDGVATFLACFAESVVHSNPCSWYFPNGDLTEHDIDMLMPHFLYNTPRSAVLSRLKDELGYERAYTLMLQFDPMIKARIF